MVDTDSKRDSETSTKSEKSGLSSKQNASETPQGYLLLQHAITKPLVLPALTCALEQDLRKYAKERVGAFVRTEHETGYSIEGNNLEILIWALGLICMEWSLENLGRKSNIGHCQKHKDNLPCNEGVKLHKEMYDACKKSFEEVIRKSNPHLPT